ncbi:MAG: 50S ribosomal protein L21 [Rickettsiales bacterium]
MFAVIKTGGKQYKVEPGSILKTEKIEGDVGDVVEFGNVLATTDDAGETRFGAPLLEGAKVTGTILEQKRDPKILVFKKKRRHNYRRKNGHRQYVTLVKIESVN